MSEKITLKEMLDKMAEIDTKLMESDNLKEKDFLAIGEDMKKLSSPTDQVLLEAVKGSLAKYMKEKELTLKLNFSDANELFTIITKWLILDKRVNIDDLNKIDEKQPVSKDCSVSQDIINLISVLFDWKSFMFFVNFYKIITDLTNRYAQKYSNYKKTQGLN